MASQAQNHSTALREAAQELKKIKDIAFPVATMGLLNYIKGMVSVICMGRLGRLELSGGSLAIGFTNITGYSLITGLAMGMDPLCSRAFGSRNLPLATQTLYHTITMLLLASLPISLLWLNLHPLMLTLNQNPDITEVAALYCRFAIPDLIANSLLQPLKIYLRNQANANWPLMWCTLLSLLLHLPITIFLTFALRLASLASLSPLFYDTESATNDHQLGHTKSCFSSSWRMLIRLSLPSCLAVCLEWWWYELMTLLSGYLPEPHIALAASAIVIQTTSLMYIMPMSLSSSVSTRVGNELGANRPSKARLATTMAMALSSLASIAGLVCTNVGRRLWGRIFTEDVEVLDLVAAVLPILGLCELANCVQTTGCGVLRGSARPNVCAAINFWSFYMVGAPVAVVLAFAMKLGFLGLCYGLLAAQIFCAVCMLTAVWRIDWGKEVVKAKELVGIRGLITKVDENERVGKCVIGDEMVFLREITVELHTNY
ncbi:hypothetical protein Sjap_007443 [Stephania japonica]|uniref:Protein DETOXIFICATION n=1 Tax=Stephania japonica TaxID=461633 RepID=A0AAP0JN84_9MAGN